MTSIYTIGYQGRSVQEVISMLQEHRIDELWDVRSVPRSRKPGFSIMPLACSLRAASIKYVWKGDEMGATHKERNLAKAGNFGDMQSEYEKRLRGSVWKRPKGRICLLCFERNHKECHRFPLSGLLAESFCLPDMRGLLPARDYAAPASSMPPQPSIFHL